MLKLAPNTSIALIANGAIENPKTLVNHLLHYSFWVALDGGLSVFHELSLKPHLILGDFDSAPLSLLAQYSDIQQIETTDQNKTDLEKALDILLPLSPKEIVVFGALGHRFDHTLTNICLLSRHPVKVIFETERERLFVIDKEITLQTRKGQIISLIPIMGPVFGVTTSGLKWEIKGKTLDKGFFSISNQATQKEVHISCEQGDLLISLNKS